MSVNFGAIQTKSSFTIETILEATLKPWSEVFEFEYDKETLEPVNKVSKLSEPAEGVYRPESTRKTLTPKANPYKGHENNKYRFKFEDPIFSNIIHAKRYSGLRWSNGKIDKYPLYIYSQLKVIMDCQADDDFAQAMQELETLITMGDMHFTECNDYRGNSYKYDCPFFLSFLKTQLIILLVNDTSIRLWRNKEGAKHVDNFGVYDPYYKVASSTHPAIYLDVEAMRAHAQKEQKNPIELYQRVLLTLLAYAYQDPTNEIDEKGTFTKMSMDRSDRINIHYDEQAAEAFVDSYLNLLHN